MAGIRTGAQYLGGVNNGRNLWYQGRQVTDILNHPKLGPAAHSYANLYDMQHDPLLQEILTYPSEDEKSRYGMSFLVPYSTDDLARRRKASQTWAERTGGLMGRSPDFMNTLMTGLVATSQELERVNKRFHGNIVKYYELVRDNDLFLTHVLVSPQVDRSKNMAQHDDQYLNLAVVRETEEGIIVRGAKMVGTAAPHADEMIVWPFGQLSPEEQNYAAVFAIPTNAKGLQLICRESLTHENVEDHPLSGRYEEMDCMAIFDDVLVPWERVFALGDIRIAGDLYSGDARRRLTAHQTNARLEVKMRLAVGIAIAMAEAVQTSQFLHVKQMLGEMVGYAEMIRSALLASEAQAEAVEGGAVLPLGRPLFAVRNFAGEWYPRMLEIIKILGAGGLVQIPASVSDFQNPELAPILNRFYRAASMGAEERTRLYKLAWDMACSGFASRQSVYERYYAGDPVRLLAGQYESYPKSEYHPLVQAMLASAKQAQHELTTERVG